MRFSARTWSLLSLLLFVAAAFFWLKGNEYQARKNLAPRSVAGTNAAALQLFSTQAAGAPLASLTSPPIAADSLQNGKPAAEAIKKRFPYRLQNTEKALNELVKDDGAVLLANALIDTRGALPEIPRHLKAAGDPGSYIVQWKGAPGREFRAQLSEVGAEIISYVPNNAYYVKIDRAGADRLAGSAGVQSVMPYEPYYKLDQALLPFAVEQRVLPADAVLRLTLLPGTKSSDEVLALGAQILASEPSTFGPQLIIRPQLNSLVELAQLSAVQAIERSNPRKLAADLSRVTLGISPNGETNENYLDLTGAGTLVNINDTGIQPNHPTLVDTTIHTPAPPLRALMLTNNDPDGHGTFVASLIAGNGADSPSAIETNTIPATGTNTTSSNVVSVVLPGSTGKPSLRGMAPEADLLALPLDPTGPGYADVTLAALDSWLIESAAMTNYFILRRTNALISNNSWTYGIPSYDSSAARYDQAVRDSLSTIPNDQPLLFVFAAGNSGFGDEDGTGGSVDTIESPGTAKNVITVGALETLRLITNVSFSITNVITETNQTETETNVTITTNIETFFPFAGITDSSDEVASFSSRGNVGVGIEGEFGRFKPDVVAPGTMLISARSQGWNFNGFNTNESEFGRLFYDLHTNLQPYRFDSGSTFAAANISGMLALMQEYFQSRGPVGERRSPSPALMKALLINGARSLTANYDLSVREAANHQGWGLPNLPNSLSSYSTNDHSGVNPAKLRLRFVEQSGSNAVATGESRTWNVTLSSNAAVYPLRATLVWTDPPGNPAVAVKLVNDLDLVITNLDTGTVFYGNDIVFGGDFTEPVTPEEGVAEPVDSINNVENVMLRDPSEYGREFSITVRARRVNVNTVPDHLLLTRNTNDVVQDFALIIASDIGADPDLNDPDPSNPDGYLPNSDVFEQFDRVAQANIEPRRLPITLTNGLPLLEQRIGANPSLLSTNGAPGQWNFYAFTNVTVSNSLVSITAGSNVAFVTFNTPNLSRPRSVEADVDLYVSTNAALTNLNAAAVSAAFKSVERGGTESVVFTNATLGTVFYIGVKSEDQQGAEFSLIGVSTDLPFEQDRNGRSLLLGVPIEAAVLDGSARRPTAGTMLAIGLSNRRVAHVVVTNQVFHENYPDLVGVLTHGQTRVILNNHSFINGGSFGTATNVYDDNPMFATPNTKPTDGPGNLNLFVGQKVIGPWILEMIDNSPSHTGRVQLLTLLIDPLRDPILFGELLTDTIDPNQIAFYPLDIPPNATNLTFRFANVTAGGRLEFFWRRDQLPTTNDFEFRTNIVAPGLTFSLPVIGGGTYYMGLRNPTGFPVTFDLIVDAQFANDSANRLVRSGEIPGLLDAAITNEIIDVDVDRLVADVRVGVRMKHPRTADTVLSLISPQGTRVMLAENRGFTNNTGFGSSILLTNQLTNGSISISTQSTFLIFTDQTNLASVPVKFANPGGSVSLGVQSAVFANGFEGSILAGNYPQDTALAGGWTVVDSLADTNAPSQVSIINGSGYAHSGDTLLSLGTAGIRRQVSIARGGSYTLRFAARAAPVMDFYSTGVDDSGNPLAPQAVDRHYQLLRGDQTDFFGPETYVLDPSEPPFQAPLRWMPNDLFSQWIAPYPLVPTNNGIGQYVFRTYINMYEQNTATAAIPSFWWSGDDDARFVRLNGIILNYPGGDPLNFSTPRQLGGLIPGLNVLDFFVEDQNDVEGLRVEVLQSVQPTKRPASMTVNVGGVARDISLTPNWQMQEVTFTATNIAQTVDFLAKSGEVWIDTVSVQSSDDVFVLPEESLEILDGERAMGEWRLEVRDTRTGAVLPTGEVLEWNLEVSFAITRNPALILRGPDLSPLITLRTNQVQYVVLDPCRGATFARLVLQGRGNFDGIEMRADLSGFPTGDPEKEDFVPIRNNQNPGQTDGRAVFEISRALPAPARLNGKPIYLAIYNRFVERTNSYDLEFFTDGDCTPLTPPPEIEPGAGPTPGVVDPGTGGGGNTNANQGIYQFVVGPNVRSVTVTVVSDGDVSVTALKGEPPTPAVFSHFVDNIPTAGTEVLTIDTTSGIPLTPGTWFVRVGNNTGVPVNFTITVTMELIIPPGEIRIDAFLIAGELTLSWNSTPGVTYEVQGSDVIFPANWTSVATVPASGGARTTYTPAPGSQRYRFYRVMQRP